MSVTVQAGREAAQLKCSFVTVNEHWHGLGYGSRRRQCLFHLNNLCYVITPKLVDCCSDPDKQLQVKLSSTPTGGYGVYMTTDITGSVTNTITVIMGEISGGAKINNKAGLGVSFSF